MNAGRMIHGFVEPAPPERCNGGAAEWMEAARRMLRFSRDSQCFSIGLAPATQADASRWFVTDLTLALARTLDAKVLVIAAGGRADLAVERHLSVPSSPGLQEMLQAPPSSRFDTIHESRFPNVYVLPRGGLHAVEGEAVPESGMAWVHRTVRPHFRAIVAELPPLDRKPYPAGWLAVPDACFLTVRKGTPGKAVRNAAGFLEQAGAAFEGSVFLAA